MAEYKKKIALTSALAVIIALGLGLGVYYLEPLAGGQTTTSSSSSATSHLSTTAHFSSGTSSSPSPRNFSLLVDDWAESHGGFGPFDPALQDVYGYYANVFQSLVEYSPNNSNQAVPALASSWTVSSNYENYTFTMRTNTWFSNMDPVNAYVAWFSFVRTVYVGNVPASNFAELTYNSSDPRDSTPAGNLFPHGLQQALMSVGVPDNENSLVAALNQMLSDFNPSNQTQISIMSYPGQAYVAESNSTFAINLIQPYTLFLSVLPASAPVVDPTFIDAHGGVQNSTFDTYFLSNGMPGTGPYELKQGYVQQSQSGSNVAFELTANPDYWGRNVSQLAPNLAPAKINTIQLESEGSDISAFASNNAQLISPLISNISEAFDAYEASYPGVSFSSIFLNEGYTLSEVGIVMDPQYFPTNSSLLREAIVHAINYSAVVQQLFTYNGTQLGVEFSPPTPPGFGPLDNPDNVPVYQYNLTLAIQLANQAGIQGNFSLALPNGMIIGNPSGERIDTLYFGDNGGINSYSLPTFSAISKQLQSIGLTLSGPSVISCIAGSCSVDPLASQGFEAAWPDPIQLFYSVALDSSVGPGTQYRVNFGNSTLTKLISEIPFETNQALQVQQAGEAYAIFSQLTPMIQLPTPAVYYFVQPYLQNVVYNQYENGIWYDMVSYS